MMSTRLVKQYRCELVNGTQCPKDQFLMESYFNQCKLKQGGLGRGAANIVQFINMVVEDTNRVVYEGTLSSII